MRFELCTRDIRCRRPNWQSDNPLSSLKSCYTSKPSFFGARSLAQNKWKKLIPKIIYFIHFYRLDTSNNESKISYRKSRKQKGLLSPAKNGTRICSKMSQFVSYVKKIFLKTSTWLANSFFACGNSTLLIRHSQLKHCKGFFLV